MKKNLWYAVAAINAVGTLVALVAWAAGDPAARTGAGISLAIWIGALANAEKKS